ncbi:MAG: indolepyruvate ferredoxin oxidoreductase, partial [Bacteroidales bacterium]|nr:indolepyruvate ferredoxin oxidoreductase [Bacteroidales bacterium]
VAADPFINSAITGANGAIVVVAADDPSMHSSQNEQDSRFYADFAMLPVFEPSNQQEAYDMTRQAFVFSEKYKIPVMLRITTRLAHSRAAVVRKDVKKQNNIELPADLKQFVLLPAIARKRNILLIRNQQNFINESVNSQFNSFIEGADKSLGIIACGLSYNYLLENYPGHKLPYSVLKIGQYPMPVNLLKRLTDVTKQILVLEEGYPLIENMLKGYIDNGLNLKGRLDGTLPRDGELTPQIVAKALDFKVAQSKPVSQVVVGRPPSLCKGCPHSDAYNALNEAMEQYGKAKVFSDIGCYTLGALPPFNAINSCVDMGASITMAKGAADAGLFPAVAVIGDSTFTHSGMTGLLDCINANSPVTIIILDNSTTAMTGGQVSSATGKIHNICKGLGVDEEHLHTIKPLPKKHSENTEILKKELAYKGVSVIISYRECIQTLNKRMRQKFANKVSS